MTFLKALRSIATATSQTTRLYTSCNATNMTQAAEYQRQRSSKPSRVMKHPWEKSERLTTKVIPAAPEFVSRFLSYSQQILVTSTELWRSVLSPVPTLQVLCTRNWKKTKTSSKQGRKTAMSRANKDESYVAFERWGAIK